MYILKKETYLYLVLLLCYLAISLSMVFIFQQIMWAYLFIILFFILIVLLQIKLQQKVNQLFREMFQEGILKNYQLIHMMTKYLNANQAYFLANMKACYEMNNGYQNQALMTLKGYIDYAKSHKATYQNIQFSLVHFIVIKLILNNDITSELEELRNYQERVNPQINVSQIIIFLDKYLNDDSQNIADCLEFEMPYYIRLQLMYLMAILKNGEEKQSIYNEICLFKNDYYLEKTIQEEIVYD